MVVMRGLRALLARLIRSSAGVKFLIIAPGAAGPEAAATACTLVAPLKSEARPVAVLAKID
jgi:hypothetical protein